MFQITVVIPSKTESNVIPCVQAIRQNDVFARIVVVDDGIEFSSSENETYLRQECDLITGRKPFIFARNCNLGLRNSYDEFSVLLNDDALLRTPNGLQLLAGFLRGRPDLGCIVPATNVSGNADQNPSSRRNENWRFCRKLPYICVMFPQSTLEKIGLLDERYCLDYGCEDDDHLEALHRAGLKSAVFYDVYVDHASLRSTFRGDPLAPKSFAQNQALYNAKWRSQA